METHHVHVWLLERAQYTFQRNIAKETTFDKNSFLVYRRRNDGRSTAIENGFCQDSRRGYHIMLTWL